MTTESPTEPPVPVSRVATPAANLIGSVQQTLTDLRQLARQLPEDGQPPPSTATALTRLSRELAEAAAMVRAIPGHPDAPSTPGPRPIGVPMLGTTAVRGLLTAVSKALDIPPPAGPDDEMTFLRLRSERATEALRSVLNFLSHPSRTDLDLSWCAAWLDEALEQYPADQYSHSTMSQ
jgi:hypothetical protein